MANKYVVFKLESEFYGIAIERVERILPEPTLTKVPKAHPHLLGIFDLRGQTLPAIDLRRKFGMADRDGTSTYVVVECPQGHVAVRVDAVDGIVEIDDATTDDSSTLFSGKMDPWVTAVARDRDRLVVLLEPTEVATHAEFVEPEPEPVLAKPAKSKKIA
ncbi:MAG: purine-binding chemotaxis protein CheW [Chthonomonas sp.]|nr:purine-binding chemotaxis protein CheW [Chthonomonas sp.]